MSQPVKLFIEQVIQRELEEMAKTPQEAVNQSLALYLDNESGDYINAILYNPSKLPKRKTYDPEGIVGVLELSYNGACNAWQVFIVAAEKGYGPMMYDIGFSLAGKRGLMADRETVSNAAKKIWNYVARQRKNDFRAIKVDDGCESDASAAPNDPLNYKYVLKQPIDVTQLQSSHSKFMASLPPDEVESRERLLRDFARQFFGRNFSL